MRIRRRALLQAAVAAAASGSVSSLSWAEAGAPAYLSAAKLPSGAFALVGLSAAGEIRFTIPLPGRGHAAATHAKKPLAVAFARRPGVFALVVNCATGLVEGALTAPAGRHFCGHGAFDPEGALLFTAENAFEEGAGRIGVWSVKDDFRRIDEFPSGGVGPHEVIVDARQRRLIAANGGIQTHPASGRAKLNLATMRPNLAYLDLASGEVLDRVEPTAEMRLNSLRHLAVREDGLVAIAAQWQGDVFDAPPLVATHRFGESRLQFRSADPEELVKLQGYGGSVSFSGDGEAIALTSPRGGRLQIYSASGDAPPIGVSIENVCGVAPAGQGFLASDGGGRLSWITVDPRQSVTPPPRTGPDGFLFDNHLIQV